MGENSLNSAKRIPSIECTRLGALESRDSRPMQLLACPAHLSMDVCPGPLPIGPWPHIFLFLPAALGWSPSWPPNLSQPFLHCVERPAHVRLCREKKLGFRGKGLCPAKQALLGYEGGGMHLFPGLLSSIPQLNLLSLLKSHVLFKNRRKWHGGVFFSRGLGTWFCERPVGATQGVEATTRVFPPLPCPSVDAAPC